MRGDPLSSRFSAIAALLAGCVFPLGFAPLGWYPLAILALAALFRLWWQAPPRRALRDGYLFGLGMFGVGVSWLYIAIHDMGHLELWLSLLIIVLFIAFISLYPALLGYLVQRWGSCKGLLPLLLVMPAGWVVAELLRGWFLTGFPWLFLGHSQPQGPLRGLLPLVGTPGVSWLMALSAGLLVALWITPRLRHKAILTAGLLLAWGLAALTAGISWTQPLDRVLRVSLIQAGIQPQVRWSTEKRAESIGVYLDLTRDEWGRDLIVWPESAMALFYHEVPTLVEELERRAEQAHSQLVIGVPYLDLDAWKYYNAVVRIPGPPQFYFKHHLVPFTEYLPLKPLLGGLVDFFQVPMSDFSHGDPEQTPLDVDGIPVGVTVCYEVAYSAEVLAPLPTAELLINVSNDGWFGRSLGPHQHLQMAQVRALEAGRYMLRATDSGISAIIRPDGAIAARTRQFEPAVLRGEVRPMTGATPYVRWGDVPVGIALAISLLLGGIACRRRRRPPAQL